jgi:hypothetical protein
VISTVVERGHVMCAVYEVQPTSLVDQDRAHRPSRRRTGCSVPRSWFEIAAPVRFRVDTFERHGDTATVVDRAPNHGRYLGL